ncbi:MAG TPA: hypothetical protein VEI97_16025, partial [bacterium]|nr:hypothetical protein [bacterium]
MFHRPPAPRLTPYVFGCALAALLALGCSKGGDDASPVAGASNPASGLPASPDVWGSGVLAVVTGVINPDGTLGLDAPPRSGLAVGDTFDLDATEFFTQGPCYDCIEVTGISRDGAGNLRLPFAVRHPFGLGVNGRYDLHLFDARGILILPGSSPFPGLGSAPVNVGVNTIADQVLTGDPELVLNADGYTTYFDYHAANPAYGPPRTIPGNLNPFKRYFVDENPGTFDHANPAGWNVFPMGSPTETQEFILDGVRVASLGTVPFAF